MGDTVGGGLVGDIVGNLEGLLDGCSVGPIEGMEEGIREGDTEGRLLGCWENVGDTVGESDGMVELLGENVSVGYMVILVMLVMLLGDQVMFPVGNMVSLGYMVEKSWAITPCAKRKEHETYRILLNRLEIILDSFWKKEKLYVVRMD